MPPRTRAERAERARLLPHARAVISLDGPLRAIAAAVLLAGVAVSFAAIVADFLPGSFVGSVAAHNPTWAVRH